MNTIEANPWPNNFKKSLPLDMLVDLLENEDKEIMKNLDKCPVINIEIQEIDSKALIGTGREVTCISEAFFENNREEFRKCELLLIAGTSIVGATGEKPVKLKYQIYANFKIGN